MRIQGLIAKPFSKLRSLSCRILQVFCALIFWDTVMSWSFVWQLNHILLFGLAWI